MSTEPDRPPDGILIRRFLGGDEGAFRQLYRRHTPRLRMMVLRLVGYRDADADDVVQETWLACCRSLHGFRGDAQFPTWLTTIGVRAAKRRMASALADPDPFPDGDPVDLPPTWPARSLDASIDAERLLRRLSERARIVFTLHVVEGFSHDEIARELAIAPGTSRAILSRALTSLRTHLHAGVSHGE